MAATSVKINADDEHLERLTDIAQAVDARNRLLLDGNLELEEHMEAVRVLSTRASELAELAANMQADVARLVTV